MSKLCHMNNRSKLPILMTIWPLANDKDCPTARHFAIELLLDLKPLAGWFRVIDNIDVSAIRHVVGCPQSAVAFKDSDGYNKI